MNMVTRTNHRVSDSDDWNVRVIVPDDVDMLDAVVDISAELWHVHPITFAQSVSNCMRTIILTTSSVYSRLRSVANPKRGTGDGPAKHRNARYTLASQSSSILSPATSDVNKDWTCKDKDNDKDLTHKDQDNDKDSTFRRLVTLCFVLGRRVQKYLLTYSYLLQVAAKPTIAIKQQKLTQSGSSQHMTVKPITLNK